jgi:hypothetical protein
MACSFTLRRQCLAIMRCRATRFLRSGFGVWIRNDNAVFNLLVLPP